MMHGQKNIKHGNVFSHGTNFPRALRFLASSWLCSSCTWLA